MIPRKIVTSYVCPPIPVRGFDWCAHEDGCEEDGEYGWGETEEAAVKDFKQRYEEAEDEPLP
jgi:hypothetical protein